MEARSLHYASLCSAPVETTGMGEGKKPYAGAGWTFIQWRAICSRVATQTLGLDAT